MYHTAVMEDLINPALREAELIRQVCLFRPELEAAHLKIRRDEKGKPFLVYAGSDVSVPGLHFSISHSGGYWACIVSDETCGLDLQELRPAAAERLGERFFREEEAKYVKKTGIQGFYELWVRREALAKYTGLGFFGMWESRPCLVDGEGKLSDCVVWNGRNIVFEALEAPKGFMAVWCHEEENGGKE